jgi:hypothetical protein
MTMSTTRKSQLPKRPGVKANEDGDRACDREVVGPVHFFPGHLINGGDDEGGDHEEADSADLLQHVTVADAGGDALIDGELARQDQQRIEYDGNEAQREAELPHGVEAEGGVGEQGAEESAQRESGGPSGVQDVQPLGFVLAEHGGDDGIDEGLDRAIGHGDEQRAPVEGIESIRPQGENERDEVTDDGEESDGLVADPVDDQAEKDDAQREGPHPGPVDGSFLGFGEIEAVLKQADGVGPDAEDKGGGDEGDEAGPEKFHVGFADGGVAHERWWWVEGGAIPANVPPQRNAFLQDHAFATADVRLDAVRTGPHVRGAAGGRIDSRRLFFFRPPCLFRSQ